MCEVIEQLLKEREHEAVLKLLFEGVQDGGMKIAYAAKKANLSLAEFKEQMRLRGYTIPQRKSRSTESVRKQSNRN